MTCSKEKGDIRHHKTPGLGQIHSASIKGHAVPIHTGAKSESLFCFIWEELLLQGWK